MGNSGCSKRTDPIAYNGHLEAHESIQAWTRRENEDTFLAAIPERETIRTNLGEGMYQ
jgi:hypothetical protein